MCRYREQLAKIVRAMQTPNLKIQELLIIQVSEAVHNCGVLYCGSCNEVLTACAN
jgi:hypothetical protein